MKDYFLLLVCFWIGLALLPAQSRSGIIPPEGFYLQPRSLAYQQPEISWEDAEGEWYIGEEDQYLRGTFHLRDSGTLVRPLVICLEGSCYLLDPVRTDSSVLYYAPLLECGAICVYRIQRQYPIQIPIRAYNPVNGHPFIETSVKRRTSTEQLMMWNPKTNEHELLTTANYADWTGSDERSNMRESDLIKGIRTYNRIFAERDAPTKQD
ncbi:MAG: hypothetical protein K9I85_03440 [Saprospiraceae bacterium]|nr:hypothetical protein [Saprospiraceae bacterium]